MIPLLKRVTVLLLTAVTIGVTTFSVTDSILPVGLVFLSLSILTFALRCRKNKVTNVILINLCTTLLLYHLVEFVILTVIQPNQKLYTALEGLRKFLLLSFFVWMLIEAVLRHIYVKNLSKIRSEQGIVISWKWLMVIGYTIPVPFVGISAVICSVPFGGINCDLNKETATFLISWIPVIYIVLPNVFLYIVTIIIMIIMLRKLKNGAVQSSNAVNKRLILSMVIKSVAQFLILICPWILRLFKSKMVPDTALILSSQQGTFIFLIHCVLNQKVREMYWKILRPLCPFRKTGRTTFVSQETA